MLIHRALIAFKGTPLNRFEQLRPAQHLSRLAHEGGQQHPIKLYLVVWGWLFVLSACSYAVDYFHVQGYLRWFLILMFMIVKAGLIVAVFMHMAWERLALIYAILVPPVAVLAFVAIMAIAFVNSQAFVWHTMGVPVKENYYGALFYGMTGTMTLLVVLGLVFTAVAAFRTLGSRVRDTEILSAHALYWYFAAAAYAAVWFVVYVTK